MMYLRSFLFSIVLIAACGGAQTPSAAPGGTSASDSAAADDLDMEPKGALKDKGTGDATGDTDSAEAAAAAEPAEKPAVTFKLNNNADEDLVFSVDKGWQPVIFGFSGKPPKAKPILMFPKFCTAACDAAEDQRCPYCPAPEKVKDVKQAEKREIVAARKSLEVPWDGQVFVYEKTRGKRDGKTEKCECYRKEPVEPNTYTIRACGLRITKSATQSTKYQCVEGSMTFPANGPQVVELDFGPAQ